MQETDDQDVSTMRVSIKSVTSDGNENGSQASDSESASSSENSEDQDSPREQDWEQAPTRKHMVYKPKWVVLKRKQNSLQL